jgi:hypothetical protein
MITLNPKEVEELFEQHTQQGDVLVALYKMVIPEWDNVKKVKGWPAVNDYTWKRICSLFQEFDSNHHPGVMPGGCWMNTGFSTNHDIPDWEVSMDNCTLEMNEEE